MYHMGLKTRPNVISLSNTKVPGKVNHMGLSRPSIHTPNGLIILEKNTYKKKTHMGLSRPSLHPPRGFIILEQNTYKNKTHMGLSIPNVKYRTGVLKKKSDRPPSPVKDKSNDWVYL